jgi:hypothetical protein
MCGIHLALRQFNVLRSWRALHPITITVFAVNIYLFK